jgi:UDP-GlcNAc3NAcA epimerase
MRIVTILGARPQFIKAAAVSRAISKHNLDWAGTDQVIEEIIVHTGQHFDANMSDVFFAQLGIPTPNFSLGVAGLSHGAMTGRMLEGIESLLLQLRPDWVLVYGDTNSTLAGALAAVKLRVPVAHVEAGLRSHNLDMPEEINRVLTDRSSTLLLCPTRIAVDNLAREGFPFAAPGGRAQKIEQVGDVMLDVVLHTREVAVTSCSLADWNLEEARYALCTLHRQENTDDPERLLGIMAALREIARELPVLLPLHPRTRQRLVQLGDSALAGVRVIDPLPYLQMQRILMSAKVILTDSGGLQKEAFFHRVPCITLRDQTEWTETVEAGWNHLVGAESKRITGVFGTLPQQRPQPPALFGDGYAGDAVVHAICARRQT